LTCNFAIVRTLPPGGAPAPPAMLTVAQMQIIGVSARSADLYCCSWWNCCLTWNLRTAPTCRQRHWTCSWLVCQPQQWTQAVQTAR